MENEKKSKNFYIVFFFSLALAFIFTALTVILALKMLYIPAGILAFFAIVCFNSAPVLYHKAKKYREN